MCECSDCKGITVHNDSAKQLFANALLDPMMTSFTYENGEMCVIADKYLKVLKSLLSQDQEPLPCPAQKEILGDLLKLLDGRRDDEKVNKYNIVYCIISYHIVSYYIILYKQ